MTSLNSVNFQRGRLSKEEEGYTVKRISLNAMFGLPTTNQVAKYQKRQLYTSGVGALKEGGRRAHNNYRMTERFLSF